MPHTFEEGATLLNSTKRALKAVIWGEHPNRQNHFQENLKKSEKSIQKSGQPQPKSNISAFFLFLKIESLHDHRTSTCSTVRDNKHCTFTW